MATVIVGGLTSAMILILTVLPSLYLILVKGKDADNVHLSNSAKVVWFKLNEVINSLGHEDWLFSCLRVLNNLDSSLYFESEKFLTCKNSKK